jgi:hypothetical protein
MVVVKLESHTSINGAPASADLSNDQDAEKNGPQHGRLQRQISEPPYTIWGRGAKIWILFLVSISALISPFGATTFFPALNVLTEVLDITPTQLNLSITTYMVRPHIFRLEVDA